MIRITHPEGQRRRRHERPRATRSPPPRPMNMFSGVTLIFIETFRGWFAPWGKTFKINGRPTDAERASEIKAVREIFPPQNFREGKKGRQGLNHLMWEKTFFYLNFASDFQWNRFWKIVPCLSGCMRIGVGGNFSCRMWRAADLTKACNGRTKAEETRSLETSNTSI